MASGNSNPNCGSPGTLAEVLAINALRYSDTPAYIDEDGRQITHSELLRRARQVSSALEKSGLGRQHRAAVLSMNSIEFGEILAAGQYSGIIITTVNFRLAPAEIHWIINDSSPKVLFFEAQYLDIIDKLRPELSSIEIYVCIGGSPEWAVDYEEYVATGGADGPGFQATPDDICTLIYTSGTTGRPKGCILGQREMRIGGERMSIEMRSGPLDRILLVMPLFHIGAMAMGQGIHFRGGTAILHRAFDPGKLLAAVANDYVTILHLAPTLVQLVLEHPAAPTTDFSKLQTIVYSAAPMPVPVLRKGMEMIGNIFVNLYGQTEVFSSGLPRELHRPYGSETEQSWLLSVGHPFPNTRLRIVDDKGNDCPTGTPGEIIVSSGTMARGYWNNHAATLETFRDGWCYSGDIGQFDENGLLYLVDRKKDVIISGGENIYSREVEEAIMLHAAVMQCAVIGKPDPKWGESVCAVIVRRENMKVSEAELLSHCREKIASYKKPRHIVFVTELPKLATGKIDKKTLRKEYG